MYFLMVAFIFLVLNPIICSAIHLFCVQDGTYALFPFSLFNFYQVASSLNSSYCFILHSGSTVFTWAGNLTSPDDQGLVERQLDLIKVWCVFLSNFLLRNWFRLDGIVAKWIGYIYFYWILGITLDSVIWVFNLGL